MDQMARHIATDILSVIPDLDYAASQFCDLMLTPPNPGNPIEPYVHIQAAEKPGDLLIECHRVPCIAKYEHALERLDGKNGLMGQYNLYRLNADGKPYELIWTLQFDRYGNTDLVGNAESILAQPVVRAQVKRAFLLYIVDSIQRSLRKPIEAAR